MICKKCRSEIDNKAAMCVHCVAKTKNFGKDFGNKKIYQRWWFWVLLILIVLYIIGSLPGEDIPDGPTTPTTVQTESVTKPATEETTEATTEETEPATTVPQIKVYDSGMYKVGSEIDAGEYFVMADPGRTAYLEVNKDSSGSFQSVVANENISTFFFITVSEGQYLSVKRGTFVKAADAKVPGPDDGGKYGEGMYRVGTDIPAGEYKISPDAGDSAYIEVSSDSLGSLYSIVANENTTDPIYITVDKGQYLKVRDGAFAIVE